MAQFIRPEIIRPPSESASYFLPLTSGCSNNTCTFCNYYGCKLQMRDVDEVKAEIDAVALYVKDRAVLPGIPNIIYHVIDHWWDGKKIFLQDGDALVYPFERLKYVLEYIRSKLPFIEQVATYGTAQDVLRKSADELKKLKKLRLSLVYMGVESGDDEILQQIGKGVTSNQIIEAGKKTKAAGIRQSLTVILGLGGNKDRAKHVEATARVLSEIDPEFAAALTMTITPGTPLYNDWQDGKFELISPMDSLVELKAIVEQSNFSDCFFSSMHASNYFSIRGKLPQEKERMIKELASIIEKQDPSLLRPEYLRGL
ncbi:MAG: radical SAM protein [Chloroflexi bacterium]|jgi:radical SAM superfamily enzyme YgiQ (UPF0313 family)|nr:radical SAM protein [Chloroflexota bacterium]MBT7080090.1 radical SAM protein [Chloroflexota bacterium]MBT7290480.1 radical SAM protein [Chloroflexota bacterium]